MGAGGPAGSLALAPSSFRAQSPDDALAVQQEIERVPDIGHEYIGARHRLDGTTLARIDGNREAPGIPDRCQPQSIVPAIAENRDMFQLDAKSGEIIALERVMRFRRDLVVQPEWKALQLRAGGFACVRRDDVNIDELAELAKAPAHAFDELALARQRSRVVTAYRLDVQMTEAGDVDPYAAFHCAYFRARESRAHRSNRHSNA